MKKILLILLLVATLSNICSCRADSTVKGIVVSNSETEMTVEISEGKSKGLIIKVEPDLKYNVGDNVYVTQTQNNSYITDHNRINSLLVLLGVFVFIVIAVSKKSGFYSLIGLIYSFAIIIFVTLPILLEGWNPLLAAIINCLLIAPVTFYLSHGFNKKTTVALFSTLISLLITGILAVLFIKLGKITGFASDEAFFLQIAKDGNINMQGIFLAGVVIGTLGILDDITISQAAIVQQLKTSTRQMEEYEVFKRAMSIGHDHISSAVNTLVLVYAGASLPLLLLFVNSSKPILDAVNSEIIASEILRTLIGSIGLILAVPISTLLSTLFITGKFTPSNEDVI